ncbi:hypothetical protein O7623_01170 [Solwaraspora sp. WMMD791]|nr:hypothetical protein [Solwaraspora sp. WMMD791]WFE27854.1 hypothetical protein O7623_01170 [Solwaraspora sp. WMMD791]
MLLAVERNDRRMWAIHHLALEEGRRVIVPSVVVAQAWRDPRRQAQLGRFLHSCEVVQLGFETAKSAGQLCGRARTADIVDATVVTVALACGAIVFTSDPDDVTELAAASEVKPGLVVRRV